MLESLVTSRALSLARERELDPKGRAELNKAVARYREQLLVEQYVAEHFPPKPVSSNEVANYYAEHATSFGTRKVRSFELLTIALAGADSADGLAALTRVAQTPDWKSATAKKADKHHIEYQTGTVTDQVQDPRLRHTIRNLTPGQTSATVVVDGRAYVIRVTGETMVEGKTLAEVSASIERSLAATALRESVSRASESVRKQMRIEYLSPKSKP